MHSYSSLAVVFMCWVRFALLNKIILLAREGRAGVEGWGSGSTLSLLDFKHLVPESALETSFYQAVCMVSGKRLALLEAAQGKDVT